jgi:hypothetical protein
MPYRRVVPGVPCIALPLLAAFAAAPRAAVAVPGPIALSTPPMGASHESLPDEFRRARVPANLLVPLPRTGGIPRMVPVRTRPGNAGDWERHDAAFAALRARNFTTGSSPKVRASGLAALRECRDPAAFESMYRALRGQKPDVVAAMLDSFAAGGDEGQYALASVAIQDPDAAVRAEATRRLARPPSPGVLAAIDDGIRAQNHQWVNNAGILAGAVHAIEAIPQLIFAQYVQGPADDGKGDRAWIAIGTTTSYVANVIPIVGDNAAAFQPVIGQIIEGVVFRVQDCVATAYHGGVHDSLVAMTTFDSGTDTASIGWDMRAWASWFDHTYVPLKKRQDEELAKAAAAASPAP